MPTARTDEYGKRYHLEYASVALGASGENTTTAVTFDVPYPTAPIVHVVPILGLGGTQDADGFFPNFRPKTITATGFIWNIAAGATLANSTVLIKWFAHEAT